MAGDERASWAEQRERAVAAHAAADERRRAAEVAQARGLVADFAREATARGLRSVRLMAQGYAGGRFRTRLRGWYLSADHTLAVGTDGEYYVLTVPGSLRARFTGVAVAPQDPRLVVGEGARDGESMPLRALLRQRLDAGDGFP